ncbi:MAG: ANTAR domain-containing protein [Gemmataceae bacterium]
MHQAGQHGNPLRVLVVEDEDPVRRLLVETLEKGVGYRVIGQVTSGLEMVETVLCTELDVLLFDIHLPQLSGIDALRRIAETKSVAAVAISGDYTPASIRKICHERIHGLLLKPVEPHLVGPTLELALARFEDHRRVSEENERLQRSLENRKLIERAKGVLMRRYRWTEADAFRRIQRAAMNQRTTMADLARHILEGKEFEF